jgi:hypothetical protein
VVTDLGFLLSIAALSLSLAGLAGLVAGLRRSDGLRPLDMFRLREIVEFAFANALIALLVLPVATLTGSVDTAVRVVATAALAYLIGISLVLFRRLRTADIAMTAWVRFAAALDALIVVTSVAAIITGSLAVLQLLLILFLARPMMVFLFVLASFDTDLRNPPPSD